MIKELVSIEEVIDLLNEALKSDSNAINELFSNRVNCNDELSNHPTIQCGRINGNLKVGILGILNGIFGIADDGYGAIAAHYNDENIITKFSKIR